MPTPSLTNPLSGRTRDAYEELAHWLVQRHRDAGLRVLGINGSQGSGKSTLAAFLVDYLGAKHSLNAIAVSLDDFYLGQTERTRLAATTHPLLTTRGVPGTHDAKRGRDCLQQLRSLRPGDVCRLPRFSKATDDALEPRHDRLIVRMPDLILFEGWCVGTPPQDSAALQEPVNDLERTMDRDGAWRRYVNAQLAGPYAKWFSALDALVYLQVPGWEQVRGWRAQQELETAADNGDRSAMLEPSQLDHFLQHYQRLTEHALRNLPDTADVVVRLNRDHEVDTLRYA